MADLAVIIPALDESARVRRAVSGALTAPGVEVLVVDGGSRDDTAAAARAAGARVISHSPGRAAQMNAGARLTTAPVLLFLHADSVLPPAYDRHVREMLSIPGVAMGAFRLGIAGNGIGLRLVEWGANLRSSLLGLPYGDQAFFMTAARFREAGGFPEVPIMEDYLLVRRLGGGGRVALASAATSTSARRWERLGIGRVLLLNQMILAGYHCRLSLERLASWYRWPAGRAGEA